MARALYISVLVLAIGMVIGAGALAVHHHGQARDQLAAEGNHLAAQRADAFVTHLSDVTRRMQLLSSDDALAAVAREQDRRSISATQRTAAIEVLQEIRSAAPDGSGVVRILTADGKAQLAQPADATGVPAPPATASGASLTIAEQRTPSDGRTFLIVSAPILGSEDRFATSVAITVPVEALSAATGGNHRRAETLLVDGSSGAILSSTAPRVTAASRRVASLVGKTPANEATVEVDGYMWGVFKLQPEVRIASNPWWFVAARSSKPVPGLFQLPLVSILMLVGGVALGAIGLLRLHVQQRDLEFSAGTDQLTGIPNRRALLHTLERSVKHKGSFNLSLFDLNGFKEYNDTFGHLAGDDLLRRLAGALQERVAPAGAYRLGGDEFCVVCPVESAQEIEARAASALTEPGHGFTVDASWGSVTFPAEVTSVSEALAVADERMYIQKRGGRAGALAQTKGALKMLMAQRDPELAAHHDRVTDLSERTARAMGLSDQLTGHLRSAAELHDIGLLAIPNTVRNKTGPLTPDEREFVNRHAQIGELVLKAAESLHTAAAIVRATHERWDGNGYPVRMEGDDIPLAARVIAVCDAYDTMLTPQPYRPIPLSEADAREELRRNAGQQFDPRVVATLETVLDAVDPPHLVRAWLVEQQPAPADGEPPGPTSTEGTDDHDDLEDSVHLGRSGDVGIDRLRG